MITTSFRREVKGRLITIGDRDYELVQDNLGLMTVIGPIEWNKQGAPTHHLAARDFASAEKEARELLEAKAGSA